MKKALILALILEGSSYGCKGFVCVDSSLSSSKALNLYESPFLGEVTIIYEPPFLGEVTIIYESSSKALNLYESPFLGEVTNDYELLGEIVNFFYASSSLCRYLS